jgi:mono/diheme cytochrome c family protein
VWPVAVLAAVGVLLASAGRTVVVEAQDPDMLQGPVVLGAWLYEGNCVTCHGPYEQERVAKAYDEDDALAAALEGGSGGCFVDWGYRRGGPFRSNEIKALIAFMRAWEDSGGPLDLPPLPPQPTPTPLPSPTAPPQSSEAAPAPTPKPQLDPEIKLIIEGSELAMGAWFYTQNCHRCHLAYDVYRMGSGLAAQTIERNITKGKIGTTMPAFSRREGGELKAREIRAIVAYITAFEALDAPPALPEVLFTPPTPDPQDFLMIPLPQIAAVQGDALNGERLYARHCIACHGIRGEGGVGPQLAKVWPSLRPDLTVKAALMAGVPGTAMPAWEGRMSGDLTEDEINDLVGYVLSFPVQPLALQGTSPAPISPWPLVYLFGGVLLIGGMLPIVVRRAAYRSFHN